VRDRDLEEALLRRRARPRQLGDLVVIRVAGADGLVEDRRVRGQAGHVQLVDVALERAAVEQLAGDVVEPDALAQLTQREGRLHGMSPRGSRRGMGVRDPDSLYSSAITMDGSGSGAMVAGERPPAACGGRSDGTGASAGRRTRPVPRRAAE